MINELKKYPVYKDSGLPWLGEVPEHWEIKRGKNVFRCIDVRSATGDEELLTVSSERGIVPRRAATVTMFKAESYINHKLCWPGDLVINSLWAWARGLGVSQYHGIVSTAYGVYRARVNNGIDPLFIHNLVRSTPFHWELFVRSKGVWTSRLQLTDDSFLSAPFPIPPLPEQSSIVHFLDHADRRIKRCILAKQKMIKLLEEQKQAIVHQAVTRGLDPSVHLKPSGVEWLGDVPEHWEVRKLKYISNRMQNGSTPSSESPEYYAEDGLPWFGPPSLGNALTMGRPTRFVSELAAREGKVRPISPPALAVSVIGNVGRSALMMEHGSTNQQITCFELQNTNRDPRFIVLQFRFAEKHLTATASSSTIAILDTNELRRTKLALPPSLEEQVSIVTFIGKATEGILITIDHTHQEILLLREYRTRLIADVVTGKLDVREAAKNLPEELNETEKEEEVDVSAEGDGGDEEQETEPLEIEA